MFNRLNGRSYFKKDLIGFDLNLSLWQTKLKDMLKALQAQ